MRLAALALVLCPLAAAAEAVTTAGAAGEPPSAWLGERPHLVLVGTAAGIPLDIRIEDIEAAEDVVRFAGKREYRPGEGGWRYTNFEILLEAVLDGVERTIELELENHDLREHAVPAEFALAAENFPEGERAFFEVQMEWETADGSVNEELGGWTGTATLLLETGEADAEGIVPDGLIGGLVVAERGTDRLVASFTVPVTETERDE